MDDDDHDSYPHTTTLIRSGRAIRAHFRLKLVEFARSGVRIYITFN